ncbi:hypothetical protein TSH7_14045 [Azospirillum sp. TSH7]|uniref:hypothetical protein n=1 Tax=unclassified Azospirillum TaxID=2630922 RepID=UPI000D61465D|nr:MULTISPECIES: hypothetical protein [unclassified Azospirillum]PWC63068.1 hypothetical protein TSH7_14045 [Azospirillum sp. TSH7]PWC72709.1 hypothetical protein TSH20_00540 [Azospirillum sp. TSH20]
MVFSHEAVRDWETRLLSTHGPIHTHFQLRRHLIPTSEYRAARTRAFTTWREATGAAEVS